MYLHKIEIQGFKSFAQKTVLEFPRPGSGSPLVRNGLTQAGREQLPRGICGIACIVGPNGSGKSNIVDAIRWVLGEQSLKSLRGKKSQDVIFSGSEKKAKLGLAQVGLHINNEDGTMPIDYREVVISRKLYRNGESEYRINQSKVRLQDVLLLLAKANFGQKSYSIVSQGSIDQVIMANPNERKDYFDEAVGVKQFQLKRDQSLNKLENAWNNLRQVDALLAEISPRLNSLTRQVKRLERREKVEKELRAVGEKYYGWLYHNLSNQIKELKPRLEGAEQSLKAKDRELKELQNQLRILEQQESRTSVFSELQQKYQKILEQKNELREEQLMLQNKIELAKNRLVDQAVTMPTSEIIGRLKKIEILEQNLINNLDTKNPVKLAQAREDARELGRLIKELVSQLENPKPPSHPSLKKGGDGGGFPTAVDPELLKDLKEIEADLKEVEARVVSAQKDLLNFNQREEKQKGKFFEIQRQLTKHQDEYNQFNNDVSGWRVEMAKLETRTQDLRLEIKAEMKGLEWLENFRAQKIDEGVLRSEISKLKHQLELIGGVDPQTVKEYKETKERYDFLSDQASDLRSAINGLGKVINDLDDKIQVQFDTAFKNINKEFSHFFKILFGGGKAELVLIKEDASQQDTQDKVDIEEEAGSEDGVLDKLMKTEEKLSPKRFLKKKTGKVITGIDIIATPPGKKVSSINMLSGGERSLASIALICAVIANNPSPFVILDEVDAALDEANSQRFAKIIGELEHKTQFIVITHNRATMHQADILYGVTMGDDGVSKLISLKLEEAQKIVRQ